MRIPCKECPRIPVCKGFGVSVDGKPTWVNEDRQTPRLINEIHDELTFDNLCNAAIIWWTEAAMKLGKSYEAFLFPNSEEGKKCKKVLDAARHTVRAWRMFKAGKMWEDSYEGHDDL